MFPLTPLVSLVRNVAKVPRPHFENKIGAPCHCVLQLGPTFDLFHEWQNAKKKRGPEGVTVERSLDLSLQMYMGHDELCQGSGSKSRAAECEPHLGLGGSKSV